MDKMQFMDTGRRVLLFIGQLAVLILCIGFIEFEYYHSILPDKQVKETYEQVDCTVVQKQLKEKGRLVHRYRADFLLQYPVQTVQVRSWATGNGLDLGYSSDQDEQQALLDQFEENQNYPCWYNPDQPKIVVLVLRHSWSSTFPLFIPSIIAVIMLYYIAQAIFLALGVITEKAKVNKSRKQ